MTGRLRTADGDADLDAQLDADLERRVRAAFAAATPGAPPSVHAGVARLAATPDFRTRVRLDGRLPLGWVAAVVLALSALVIGSLFSADSSLAPTMPAGPSGSADASVTAPTPSPSGACDLPPATVHGTWWREIGGPNAFFNWEAGAKPAGARWLLIVRFDPDSTSSDDLSVWADNLESGERAAGAYNSPMDPSAIYRFDTPAPDLPGGWYLFEQPFPTPGCWRLSAAIDGQVVGTAVVEIGAVAPSQSAIPSNVPTPAIEPTPWPAESVAPAANDVLALAGRDGVPGWLYCNHHPFRLEGLTSPTGAEDRIGPEFDVLRATIALDGDDFWGEGGPDPTFREAGRDASGVVFLYERAGAGPLEGGPYVYVEVAVDTNGWHWEGSGDCQPRPVAPPGYGQGNWTLDPDFAAPDADTRTLHLLVREEACSGGRSASGRISPAFVTWDAHQLVIELFVETLPGEGDCPAAPSTPATLRLPLPLGDRTLFDAGTIGLGGSGG